MYQCIKLISSSPIINYDKHITRLQAGAEEDHAFSVLKAHIYLRTSYKYCLIANCTVRD